MVGRTPPLSSLKKGFLPQIHHPLPLNRRESQQLLNSITSSFRKNLDLEHPWQDSDASKPAAKASRDQSIVLPKDVLNKRPTDRHLESILSNPLFSHHHHDTTQSGPVTIPTHPHEVFDSAVAKGLMTTRRAAGYLSAVSQILAQSQLDLHKGMAESGAGLRVVQWLRTSGAENSLEFLADLALMRKLIQFMFAEGLEEVAWTWLSTLGSRLNGLPGDAQTQLYLGHLFDAIIRAEHSLAQETTRSLDNSYSTFLQANRILPQEDPAALKGLKGYWGTLSWASTVNAHAHPKPSAPLYEMFVDVGRPWKRRLDIAHLELHHPTSPDHVPAVKYLHEDTTLAMAMRRRAEFSNYPKRMVTLGDDTVKRLKEVGQNDEASWVSEFIARTFFAWNIGPTARIQS